MTPKNPSIILVRPQLPENIGMVARVMHNFGLKDLIVVVLVIGVLTLLGVIIIGDYYVALQENRPVDESVINMPGYCVASCIVISAVAKLF